MKKTKNKNSKIIILCLTLFLLIGIVFSILYLFRQSNPQRDYKEIKSSGILNIATEYNSVDYYISGDTISGIQYHLAKYIEQCSGLRIKIFLENNLETSIHKLNTNKYDIIARTIPITNEMKKELAFTIPISKNKQVLVQRKRNNTDTTQYIANQIDLNRKTIHVPENSPALLRIKNLSEEIASPIQIEENQHYTGEQLMYMVAYKEIDYAVVDEKTASANLALFPNLDIKTDIGFTQLNAWALRKSSPILLDSLDKWIQQYSLKKNHYLNE